MKNALILAVGNVVFNFLAAYTYTISMTDTMEAIYIITNILAAISWALLGVLIQQTRARYTERTLVFPWIRPLTWAFKIFCGISFLRCVLNDLVILFPVMQAAQATTFVLNNVCLGIACGYASVYYRKIPGLLDRAAKHQANSRAFAALLKKEVGESPG